MPALGPVLENYLRAVGPAVRRLTDRQLLQRYRRDRDGDAFAELVRRHGPLVLGVCRRTLGDSADADDAFQLTFLALARRPSAVRRRDTASPWLYRVAIRTVRKMAARRARDVVAPARSEVEARGLTDLTAAELWTGLDEELRRLPERLRAPLVLCYLDGRSRDDAAQLLDWSVGTLKRRLETGRRLLRARLVGRGLAPAGLIAAIAGPGLRAAVPPAMAERVTRAAATVSLSSARAILVVPLVLVFGSGAVLVGAFGAGKDPAAPTQAPPPRVVETHADRFGDPLPAGAIQRLGTARHRAANASVVVTADGKAVVTVGDDLVLRTFDLATGDTLSTRVLDAPEARYTALSADGQYAVAAVYPSRGKYKVRVWDTATGKEVATVELAEPPAAVAIHGATKRVAFIRGQHSVPPSDQTACVWDFAAAGPPADFRTFRRPDANSFGEPRSLFSPDGTRLLVHQTDGRIVCWDVATRKALWEQPLRYLKFFFFHPDNKHVVISPQGAGFETWDAATGTAVPDAGWDAKGTKEAHSYWPIAASPDGKLVALFHGQRQVVLFDVAKKAIVRTLNDPLRAPNEPTVGIWAVPNNFAFTPDGTGFVWRSPTVQRWDVATGKPTWPATWDQGHTEAVTRLMYTPDGSTLVSAASDGTFQVWDMASGHPRHRLPKPLGELSALTPNGRSLVTLGDGGGAVDRASPIVEWDLASGKLLHSYKTEGECPQYGSSGDREAVVTPDGARLVTLTDNHTVNARIPAGRYLTVWDLKAGKLIREEKIGERIETGAIAPDGLSFARFSSNASHLGVEIVSAETGKELRRLADEDLPGPRTSGIACQPVYSHDGRFLATRLESTSWADTPMPDRPIKVWDPATGQELGRFPVAGPVRFEFAPDGRSLVVAGKDWLKVFELATRREVLSLPVVRTHGKHGGPFGEALAVGPGGRTATTGHADGTILVWNLLPQRPATGDVGAAWAALADSDPSIGWTAVWRLVDAPDAAIRLIGEKLRPAAADPAAADLVRRLDSTDFRTREEADRRLRALASKAEPALSAALAGKTSAELKERVEKLLAAIDPRQPLAGDDLQTARAVQVLEIIGTVEARRVLSTLTAGDPNARLTREARTALDRR
jgi:RNA polymerase sigma factor (sigma-70 family)